VICWTQTSPRDSGWRSSPSLRCLLDCSDLNQARSYSDTLQLLQTCFSYSINLQKRVIETKGSGSSNADLSLLLVNHNWKRCKARVSTNLQQPITAWQAVN